ncbi:MAG: hypothetical protein N4A65_11050 [Cohaesibacter sp.]|jgi:hypothetical protein|nr:hypothetical protein [Cohaesibacter sp.]
MTLIAFPPFAKRKLRSHAPKRLSSLLAIAMGGLVALTSLPASLQAQEFAPRSKRDEAYLKSILSLDFKKHQDVLKELGIKPGQNYNDCVCREAGYGQSSTSQFYHPGVIGTPDSRYSCQTAGDPCIVSGFGCSRHPYPSDPAIHDRCFASYPEGGNIANQIISRARQIGAGSKINFEKDLAECRQAHALRREEKANLAELNAYDYMRRNGEKLLPPPSRHADALKKKAQDHSDKAQEILAKRLAKAKKKAEDNLYKALGEKLIGNGKVQSRAIEMIETARGTIDLRQTDNEFRLRAAKRDLSKSKALFAEFKRNNPQGGDWKLAARVRKDRSRVKVLSDNKTRMIKDAKKLDTLIKSVKGLKSAYDLTTAFDKAYGSGKGEDAAQAVLDTIKLANDHYSSFYKNKDTLFAEARKRAAKGMKAAEAANFDKLSRKMDRLGAAGQFLDGVVKTGSVAMEGYKFFKVYEKHLKAAKAVADSGNYSQAQKDALRAFDAASRATKFAANYMPPGVKEMAQVYAEALQIPGSVAKTLLARKGEADFVSADFGKQGGSKAIRHLRERYEGAGLIPEDYLSAAGLNAYHLDKNFTNDGKEFVLIPDQEFPPFYLNAKNYRKLQMMAYYYPIVHKKRMTDADVYKFLESIGERSDIDLSEMEKKAKAEFKKLALRKEMADLLKQKKVSNEDQKSMFEFYDLLGKVLPKSCQLNAKTKSSLARAFLQKDRRDGVIEFLNNYGAGLKKAELALARAAKQ